MLAVDRPEAGEEPAEALREHLAAGRIEAARLALVAATKDAVYRYLRHLLRNDPAVDDLFQDAYLRAFRSLEWFRGESSSTTWMLTIARNTALNRIRRLKTERTWTTVTDDPPEVADAGANAERAAADLRLATDSRLLPALDRLPVAQREAVLLYYVEDQPIEEVARITNRTPNTVKSDLRRARLALRAALEGPEDEGK
ncbi:MAG TPA: RNA polymerase sigma factor [Candidatus Eisenbacteria bacterium]